MQITILHHQALTGRWLKDFAANAARCTPSERRGKNFPPSRTEFCASWITAMGSSGAYEPMLRFPGHAYFWDLGSLHSKSTRLDNNYRLTVVGIVSLVFFYLPHSLQTKPLACVTTAAQDYGHLHAKYNVLHSLKHACKTCNIHIRKKIHFLLYHFFETSIARIPLGKPFALARP